MVDYIKMLHDALISIGLPIDLISSITRALASSELIGVTARLAVVGALGAVLRNSIAKWQDRLLEVLFPTAYILSTDPAFDWVHTYLAQDPGVAKQVRSYRVATNDVRAAQQNDTQRQNSMAPNFGYSSSIGLSLNKKDASWSKDKVIAQILPIDDQGITVKFKGCKLWVTRSDFGYAGQARGASRDHLKIQSWFFNAEAIRDFILASHKAFFAKDDGEIKIFHPSPFHGVWFSPIARPSRSWQSVILPEGQKDEILGDIECFISDEEKIWYANRGVSLTDEGKPLIAQHVCNVTSSCRYLLYGPPGSGKTTLATGLASRLQLDLYCIDPAARGMDDDKLNRSFRSCPPGNLILIEDIDCVMPRRPRGKQDDIDEDDNDDEGDPSRRPAREGDADRFGLAASSVTLSGLLNAIDGVASQEHSILLASTNYLERLDDALKRPGRFDVHIPLRNAVHAQAIDLFKHFYPFDEYKCTANTVEDKPDSITGFIDQGDLTTHAENFAFNLFKTGVEVSMAGLQGFLLRYKKDPKRAAIDVEAWAKEMKEEQDEGIRRKEAKREERANRKSALVLPQQPAQALDA